MKQIRQTFLFWDAFLTSVLICWMSASAKADDWPQWLGPQRDGVWRETGILDRFPKDGPKVRWRFEVSNGYSGPAVANGRVYLMDRVLADGAKNATNPFNKSKVAGEERVFCLNEKDGKEIW